MHSFHLPLYYVLLKGFFSFMSDMVNRFFHSSNFFLSIHICPHFSIILHKYNIVLPYKQLILHFFLSFTFCEVLSRISAFFSDYPSILLFRIAFSSVIIAIIVAILLITQTSCTNPQRSLKYLEIR